MGKIDHEKTNMIDAFGLDDALMDTLKNSFANIIPEVILTREGVSDSKILHDIFKSVKQTRWDVIEMSEEDKEIEMYAAGVIMNGILKRFQNATPQEIFGGSKPSKPIKSSLKLPPGIPSELVDLLNKIQSFPGAQLIVGDGDMPDELKSLLKNIKEKDEDEDNIYDGENDGERDDDTDTSSDSFFLKG